jgi:hypothetical protein
MMPSRLAVRQPLFRCLRSPTPLTPRSTTPRIATRPASHQSRSDVEAILRAADNAPRGRGLNPDLDAVSVHRAHAVRRAQLIRKQKWLALGALCSMMAPFVLIKMWGLELEADKEKNNDETASSAGKGIVDLVMGPPTKTDSPRKAADEFQGKKVVVAAGDKVIAAPSSSDNPQASDPDAIELVETGSQHVPYFPRTISLPNPDSSASSTSSATAEYTLLGMGIRKVSFLRVQVYVVGLYIKTADLSTLQNHLINTVNPTASALIPGEKDTLRSSLLSPDSSTEVWTSILAASDVDMAWRVVPCRGTDFKHLQDGWMRGIASRTDEVRRKQAELLRAQAIESKTIALPKPVDEGEFADESFGLAMKEFRGLFQGRGKAPKGSVIILSRAKTGALTALYQPLPEAKKELAPLEKLGTVTDERVSRLVWLLYLAGQNVSSEPARQNVVEGCVGIVERPVGTVEGRVQ